MPNIIEKYKMKLLKFCLYYLPYGKLKKEQEENRRHYMCYLYLKKKYNKFLNQLPIYSESKERSNKVWWCWLQGEENAPDLNKACLKSLHEKLTDREIIVITKDNLNEYIELPDFIMEKYKNGIISNTHFSDIIRLELLIKYGGTWVDSSVFCTDYNRDFFDTNFFVFQNYKRGDESILLSSWFITSEKDNPILKTTRDLIYEYWKNNNFLLHYYLFHLFFTLATEKYPELWNQVPRFSNIPPHILQFEFLEKYSEKRFEQIKKMTSVHKLNQKMDFSKAKEKSFYEYILNYYKKDK